MKIEFIFDENLNKENELDIRYTIKKEFEKRELPCISDNKMLSFSDSERKDDFSNMWIIIMGLIKADWFIKNILSCTFYDEDGTKEDVFSQAWKIREVEFDNE